jgi:hypothetical protein
LETFIILRIFDHAYHWYDKVIQDADIMIFPSGFGSVQAVAWKTQSHFEILFMSASLVESLAEADWEEKDRNAMVARIARITITTISSTRVKALYLELLFELDIFLRLII